MPNCDGLASVEQDDVKLTVYVQIDEDDGAPAMSLQFPPDSVVIAKSIDQPEGYTVQEKSLAIDDFKVTVKCIEGFSKTEDAKATACTGDGDAYTLEGCLKTKSCIHPDSEAAMAVSGYKVLSENLDMTSFEVQLECAQGFASDSGTTTEAKKCENDGSPYTIAGCTPELCKEPAETPAGYLKNADYVGEKSLLKNEFSAPYWACEAPNYFRAQSVASNALIAVKCTQHETPYTLTGCEKSVCKAPGAGVMGMYRIKPGAVYEIADFKVELECNTAVASLGEGQADACARNGEAYTVSKCEAAKSCQHPTNLVRLAGAAASAETGYIVSDGASLELRTDRFLVNLECDDENGYVRLDSAVAPKATACDGKAGGPEPGSLVYKVEGCKKGECTEPATTTGYKKKAIAPPEVLATSEFSVMSWECDGPKWILADNFQEDRIAEACLVADTEYKLSGCLKAQCLPPVDINLYEILGTPTLTIDGFAVEAKCKAAVAVPGTGTATVCPNGGRPYKLEGCKEDFKCAAPPALANNGYIKKAHTTDNLLSSVFSVQLECIGPNFVASATGAKATVCEAANTAYKVEGCDKGVCTSPSDFDDKGFVKGPLFEEQLDMVNFEVKGWTCKENWHLTKSDTRLATKCEVDKQPYELGGCKKIACKSPASNPLYTIGEVTSLLKEDFAVKVDCNTEKAEGTAVAETCDMNNEPYILTGCTPKKAEEPPTTSTTETPVGPSPTPTPTGLHQDGVCTRPAHADGYMATEVSMNMATFQVTAQCIVGFEGSAIVKKCPVANSEYILEGCELLTKGKGGEEDPPEPSCGGGCCGCSSGCCDGACCSGGGGGGMSPQDDGLHLAVDGMIGALEGFTNGGDSG